MASKKSGPYKGEGSIGRKTSDATIKDMGYLKTSGEDRVMDYDAHKKAVASHDSEVLKRFRVPKTRQN